MFLTLNETIEKIQNGGIFHIAADESLLRQLPKGRWIGGTTPYFITDQGGVIAKDRLFVNEISDAADCVILSYDKDSVLKLTKDAYPNGVSFVIVPFGSEVAAAYAKESPYCDELLMSPIVGWVSGYDLSSSDKAYAFNGYTGEAFSDKAVVMHISLPADKMAEIGLVNIFEAEKDSPVIEFEEDALSVKECKINGQKVLLADYLKEANINTELPLIADYNGILINVSIKSVSPDKTVELYAPVFKGTQYRFASVVVDYAEKFSQQLKTFSGIQPIFSCNCILNFLYGKLEGKSTLPFSGPVTFGEIAYQLVNQTLVYVQLTQQ